MGRSAARPGFRAWTAMTIRSKSRTNPMKSADAAMRVVASSSVMNGMASWAICRASVIFSDCRDCRPESIPDVLKGLSGPSFD